MSDVGADRLACLSYLFEVGFQGRHGVAVVSVALFSAFNVFLCRLSAVRSEFSRRSTVRRTFCAAATLAAGGVSADFRVTLLLGFDPFMVVRRRDRDDVVEESDRDVLRRAAFVLVAALLRWSAWSLSFTSL